MVIQGCAEEASLPYESFDAVILSDVIEHVRDPLALLRMTRQWLRPGGILLVATPSLKSPSFQLMRTKWMEFKTEHLTYFSPSNLQMALYKSGFAGIKTYAQRKALSIEYIQEHFSQYPSQSSIASLGLLLMGSLPAWMKQRVFRVGGAGMVAMATKSNDPEITVSKLSVIVPVYNERSTVSTVISELMKKRVLGLETEIIVVESNSNDGSREQVLQYEGKPGIVLVFQDTARGKGHAVRAGLQVASGDIILIQDADLEYDLWDYEALIRPLVQFRRSFVLGTRHKGNSWKMRRFIASPFLAWIINVGHKMLTSCFNILYRQHVEDPFTMFKVFRRDCLEKVVLECDHFDFDIETGDQAADAGLRTARGTGELRVQEFFRRQEGKIFSGSRGNNESNDQVPLRAIVATRPLPLKYGTTREESKLSLRHQLGLRLKALIAAKRSPSSLRG